MIRSDVRVRFAPSPTGHLHIGGLRTALFNWLFTQQSGGTFLVRIEDTDRERSLPEYTESIFQALEWAGIGTDEPIVVQSERFDVYQAVINQLLQEDKAYRCYCLPTDIAKRIVPAVNQQEEYHKYDQFCRQFIGGPDIAKPFVIRFRIPDEVETITFSDIIRGPISIEANLLDDFIIARSDGQPMYNFVVVVDDAYMKITHVIRGEDHIPNTPKQLLLYQACGYKIPLFAHLPLILGPRGNRLSKRDAATSVLEYRSQGYLASALINYLVRLGWSYKDQEVFSKEELVAYFSLENVGKKGAIFDIEKLKWLNQIYIKQMSAQDLYREIENIVDITGYQDLSGNDIAIIHGLLELYKSRCSTLKELYQEAMEALHYSGIPISANFDQWIKSGIDQCLQSILQMLADSEQFNLDSIKHVLNHAMQICGLKMAHISQPLRFALIGKIQGPGIAELMHVFGKHTTRERIAQLMNQLRA